MTSALQTTVDAISVGALAALAALGIALIFGVMRLINFAHAELIMLGAYAALVLGDAPWIVIVGVVIVFVALVAVAMERVAFRPVRGASMATLLVTSFAVSYFLQNLVILIDGAQVQSLSFGVSLLDPFHLGDVRITKIDLVTIVVSLALLVVVAGILTRTRTGVELRAATENFRMARMVGVRANRVIAVAFAISGALAGTVSLLLVAQNGTLTPGMGLQPALIGFVATVIGGMGSLVGAVSGGFALGVLTVIFQTYLPEGMTPYSEAFVFSIVILFLVIRPEGLFGARLTEERA
jgi:branched-chain amino acid transport system permease protein